MYRVVVLLLFCLTIVSSLPAYFTAFKYEKFLIGRETKCFISRYEFKTKIVQNDTGEDFSNYLPTEMYDSPCYSDYKYNEMNFIRDEYENYYLVHCLFFPYENQRILCDMFNEGGSRRIVDVECNNPRLDGLHNPSFYIADYLTGQNVNQFLYGDSIMYTEYFEHHYHFQPKSEQFVCGKQIGYVPFNTVIDGFIHNGYNYWDSYLGEGYNFKTPGKRLLFRGKNHLINTEEGLLKYGNLNDELRVYISKAKYDMFINLDLTDYSFIFPEQNHDGLIIGNNTDDGFMVTSTNESFPQMNYYTSVYKNFFARNHYGTNGTYEYHWDREKRQFLLLRYKTGIDTSDNIRAHILVTLRIPGFDIASTKEFLSDFVYSGFYEDFVYTNKLKSFIHPSFKIHGGIHGDNERKLVLSLKENPNYNTVYTANDIFSIAILYHCMAFDPVKNQYLQFNQPNFTVKPFDGKNLEHYEFETGVRYSGCDSDTSLFFFGRYPIMRTNVGVDYHDYHWLSVYGDGKYDDVLKKYKPRYAFEEIIFYKFISQQMRPQYDLGGVYESDDWRDHYHYNDWRDEYDG